MREKLRQLEDTYTRLSGYTRQLHASVSLFCNQFSAQVRSRLEGIDKKHWQFYVRQWFTKYLALKDECLLLINGELIYKYQKAEHAAFVHDRGSESRVYRENTALSACSIDGWNYMCRRFPRKLSSKIEERLEELSLQVEQLGSEIHELFRRRLKEDPLQFLGVCGREYTIDDADKAERLFFRGQLVLERNTTKFKVNRHAVFAMVLDDDPSLQTTTSKPTSQHPQKRRRRLLDGDVEDAEEIKGDDDDEENERPMDVSHHSRGGKEEEGDRDGSQQFDVSISALKRDLGVDVYQMQADHDELLDEDEMAAAEIAIDDEESDVPPEDDSAFFARLEAAWDAEDYQQVIAITRGRLAQRRKRADPDRSVLLKALGVALREAGQLAESKRTLEEAVQAAVEQEDVLNEERAWTELGNTLLAMYEQEHVASLVDSLQSAYSKSLRLARRLVKHADVDPALLPTSLYNYAHAQFLKNNMVEARTALAEALAVGQQDAVVEPDQFDGLHHVLGLIWELLADVEISDPDNRLKTPAQCLTMAMQEFQRANNDHDAERIRCCLADQHIQDGEFDKAIQIAESSTSPEADQAQDNPFCGSLTQLRERAAQLRTGQTLWRQLSQDPAALNSLASLKNAVARWSVDERESAWRYARRELTTSSTAKGDGSRPSHHPVNTDIIERYSEACAALAEATDSSQWQARRDTMLSQSQQPVEAYDTADAATPVEDARVQLLRSFVEADLGKSNDFWKRRAGAATSTSTKTQRPARDSVSRTTIDRAAVPIGTQITQPRQRKRTQQHQQQQQAQQQQAQQQQPPQLLRSDWSRSSMLSDQFSLETTPLTGTVSVSILLFVEGTTLAIPTTLIPQQDSCLEVQLLASEARRRLWASQQKIVHITHLVASRPLLCHGDLARPSKVSKEQVLPLHTRIPVKQLLEGVTEAGLYSNTFDCAIDSAQQPALDRYAQLCVQRALMPDWHALREIITHGKLSAAAAIATAQQQPLAALCLASCPGFKLTEVDFSFVALTSADDLGALLVSNSTIKRLTLARCGITPHVLHDACRRASASMSLELVDVSYNPLLTHQPGQMVAIVQALLQRCPSLQNLILDGVYVDFVHDASSPSALESVPFEHQPGLAPLDVRRSARLNVQLQQVACPLEIWEEVAAFLGTLPMQALDVRSSTVDDLPHVRLWALNAMQVLLTASNISSLEFGDLYGGLSALQQEQQKQQEPTSAVAGTSSCALIENVAHPQCQLEQLTLRAAGVSCVPAQQLLQAAALYCNLQCLDLSYNRLGREVFASLEALLGSSQMCTSNLRRLYLRRTSIGYEGVCAALSVTRALQALEILDLADNIHAGENGDDTGVLVAAVKQRCEQGQQQLRVLDLSQNSLSKSARDQLTLVCQPHFFIPVTVLDADWGLGLVSPSSSDISSDVFCLARTSATT